MRYTWTCPTNKLIDVLLKHGFKKIAFDENDDDYGTYYFSKTDEINKLNKTNIIVVKRHQIYTFLETSPEFPKEEFEQIHKEVSPQLDFTPHWAFLIQNTKTKEYKFIHFQPLFVLGMIISLGAFDYTDFIKKLKLNDKMSSKQKYSTFLKFLTKNKFKTESQISPEFNAYDVGGSLNCQIEEHFGPDWICIGPEIQFSAPEIEERKRYNTRDDILHRLEEIFGHSVKDVAKQEIKDFHFILVIRLLCDFVKFYEEQKQKNKDLTEQEALKDFEQESGFEIPYSITEAFDTIKSIVESNNQMFCKHCGKIIPKDSKKCEYCNKPVKSQLNSKNNKKEA